MTGAGSAAFDNDGGGGSEMGDDMLGAPAPDASVFAPRRSTRDLIAERQLNNRRTLIPILLTCGVLLPAVGSLKWLRGPESAFTAWPVWAPLLLAALGALMLFLAIVSMIQVRQMMRRSGAQ